jgi:hypothetical protein
MRYWTTAIVVISLSTGCLSPGADSPDPLVAKKEAWQRTLDRGSFCFPESDAGVLFSLSQYGGDCKVHMVYDPKEWWRLSFRFERDGKEVLTLDGHTGSVFRTVKNVLYFAHYPRSTSGCTVAAYDLTTGKKLWETKLNAVGTPMHSAYSNRVTMGLSSLHDLDKEGEGIVSITGRESFGDYVEVLDRGSGAILAHKVYRQGFGSPK